LNKELYDQFVEQHYSGTSGSSKKSGSQSSSSSLSDTHLSTIKNIDTNEVTNYNINRTKMFSLTNWFLIAKTNLLKNVLNLEQVGFGFGRDVPRLGVSFFSR